MAYVGEKRGVKNEPGLQGSWQEIKRIIADDIVTGKAVFTDDLRVTGMVYGKVLKAPYPMRVLPGLRWDRAKACDGVHAVVTYKGHTGQHLYYKPNDSGVPPTTGR